MLGTPTGRLAHLFSEPPDYQTPHNFAVSSLLPLRCKVLLVCSYFSVTIGIILEYKNILSILKDVVLVFVRRSADKVTRVIARASYNVADRSFRLDDVSPDVTLEGFCLINDMIYFFKKKKTIKKNV